MPQRLPMYAVLVSTAEGTQAKCWSKRCTQQGSRHGFASLRPAPVGLAPPFGQTASPPDRHLRKYHLVWDPSATLAD